MKNLQKGFVAPLILGIIVLLAVSGGIYVSKNNKAKGNVEAPVVINTERQQTTTLNNYKGEGKAGNQINIPSGSVVANSKLSLYKSESCHFEVSFPSNFVNWDQPANKNQKECPNPIPSYDSNKEYLQVNALRLKSGADCNIGESMQFKLGCHYFSVEVTNSKIKGPKVENISVSSIPAERILMSESGDYGQILIQLEKDKLWYRYTHTFNQTDVKEARKISDSIISTFKFTK